MTQTTSWQIAALCTLTLSCMSFAPLNATSEDSPNTKQNPVELGTVNWGRNFDGALKTAASSKKPVLLLFQEIPG